MKLEKILCINELYYLIVKSIKKHTHTLKVKQGQKSEVFIEKT